MTLMRKLAFGYSTRCNIKCEHCVAVDQESRHSLKMDINQAKKTITELAQAQVRGISFTAGEPLLYLDDILELIQLCHELGIYSRVVTNSFWAKTPKQADLIIEKLQKDGLCQLRLSFSRWHQKNIDCKNVLYAAQSCKQRGLGYFISFVTDFSKADDKYEKFLRDNSLKFFPEPVIYAGRADSFSRPDLKTDYQDNCCSMNPYLAPDLNMYACCDAGSHFTNTNFFLLGNKKDSPLEQLFQKSETNRLYNLIRTMGLSTIALFSGYKSRDIIRYPKCELCKELFDSPKRLKMLHEEIESLCNWIR